MSFPSDFAWGCATSAYQIEGASSKDGKGLSTWDMFCQPGHSHIWHDHTGDTACDHYNRYLDDVKLMQDLGLNSYRFSISWPRVFPEGIRRLNPKGLDFYSRLVDALLSAHIQPWITLFHWDFPLSLYWRGGWLKRESADWFAEYTSTVARKLSDRVTHWITHNEPQCVIGLGHRDGTHAPGDKLSTREWLLAGHHLLLSHGKAVLALRASTSRSLQIGYAPFSCVSTPHTPSAPDIAAARQATFSVTSPTQWNSSWWMDPVYLGAYPADGLALFGPDAPIPQPGDMALIHQPLDFFGLNYYYSVRTRLSSDGKPETVPFPFNQPLTAYATPVTPSGMYWAARFYHERYRLPIVVTENGMSSPDWPSLDGAVHDPQRIDFLHRYLKELMQAHASGVIVKGYFLWTLLDNFEWQEGYKPRLGIDRKSVV